jgi:DeoR/GlpR family transcriptional regulator of sugar metabolism
MNRRSGQPLSFDRRKRILEMVNRKESISVDSLADAVRVSRMTISRDLEQLENEGLLKRVRGGAVALSHFVVAPPMSRSARSLTEEQRRIGKEASKRVQDGDFLVIESGSTCMALADSLYERNNLKIATASPMIAMRLAEIVEHYDRQYEILLAGGILNVYKNFVLGPGADHLFQGINVDIAFVSVTAIDPVAGITADAVNESSVTKVILEKCGKKTIGLIISSKFNKASYYRVTDITVFDEIITDTGLDDETRAKFEGAGIRMTLC